MGPSWHTSILVHCIRPGDALGRGSLETCVLDHYVFITEWQIRRSARIYLPTAGTEDEDVPYLVRPYLTVDYGET